MRPRTNQRESQPFGAGIFDPAPAASASRYVAPDWQPTEADMPAGVEPIGPDSANMAGPWLTLPEWVEAQAAHYHQLGNDAARLVAVVLEELALSIRFHGASTLAEYVDHVAIMRESFEDGTSDDNSDNCPVD